MLNPDHTGDNINPTDTSSGATSNLSTRSDSDLLLQNLPSFRFDDLQGRVVIVTGAASGIGRVLAVGIADQGCRLILIDRDSEKLQETAKCITQRQEANAAWVETVVCDLSNPEQRIRAMQRVHEIAPVVDGIIHNAGIDPRMPLQHTSLDFFRHVMATNVEPAVEITRDLLPNLRQSEAARVILIGSVTFDIGTSVLSAYVASKGALVGLTRSFAHELGRDGINVNCIAPGAITVEKEIERRKKRGQGNHNENAPIPWQTVQRRLVPADLLGLTCLLLSTAGGAITGQVLHVDGGLLHTLADAGKQAHLVDEAIK
jgi:NAD(P)-dependent dehydrogenase (short-subunit alcohol dehydrogenase family)